ncbi:MAG TPA: hypothetical protein VI911_11165 [Patescibacteria group bacterium]|nr:hypothetical protein [Patescibacteria group bacterium]
MFQFQIYPSGTLDNYRLMVNSASGVSAIIDSRMGIIEESLSGVAFYIKAISDYININNVGTSGYPITSGYFNHLGYTSYDYIDGSNYPYAPSVDGIISGVNVIYTSGFYIQTSNPSIQSLDVGSGLFNKVFFDDGFVGYVTINNFIFTDVIKNLYSGYIPTDQQLRFTDLNRLSSIQPTIKNEDDYPFLLGNTGVLNSIVTRPRLRLSLREFGLISGTLINDKLQINNLNGLNVSGNLYIDGSLKLGLSAYTTTSPVISETLFQIRAHTHDGIGSSGVCFSSFNSIQSIIDHFTLVQSSGSINIQGDYKGNSIGLNSNWEIKDIINADNIQKILTCKDKMYIVDNKKLFDINDSSNVIIATQTNLPRSQIIATPTGDSPALIELVKGYNRSLSSDGSVRNVRITTLNNKKTNIISFSSRGVGYGFNTIMNRKEIPIDQGVRIGRHLYISFLEVIDGTNSFSVYAIDTLRTPMNSKCVACFRISGTDWRYLKPVKYKNSIHYFILDDAGNTYCLVYNVIYRPGIKSFIPIGTTSSITENTFEYASGDRVGFNVFVYDGTIPAINESTGLEYVSLNIANLKRYPIDYTYFNGKPYVNGITETGAFAFQFTTLKRNRVAIFPKTGSGTTCISYVGKIWRGNALHIGRDPTNRDITLDYLLTRLETLTGLASPWLMNPVIYRGWLYAVAPTQSLSVWQSAGGFARYDVIDEYLPAGSVIVRRRASEIDLVEMQAYSL